MNTILHEAVKMKPCFGDPKLPDVWNIFIGEMHTRSGTSSRERSVLQTEKLKAKIHLNSLTLYTEIKSWSLPW